MECSNPIRDIALSISLYPPNFVLGVYSTSKSAKNSVNSDYPLIIVKCFFYITLYGVVHHT